MTTKENCPFSARCDGLSDDIEETNQRNKEMGEEYRNATKEELPGLIERLSANNNHRKILEATKNRINPCTGCRFG